MIAKTAPCGSASTAKRPMSGMSVGSTHTFPPAACAFATASSVSSTPKYTSQFDGMSGGKFSSIWIIPATIRSPSCQRT